MSKPPPPSIVDLFNNFALPPIESPPKELAFRVIVPRPERVTVPLDERFKDVVPNDTGGDNTIWPAFVIEEPSMLRLGLALVTLGIVRLSPLATARSAIVSPTSSKTAAPDF